VKVEIRHCHEILSLSSLSLEDTLCFKVGYYCYEGTKRHCHENTQPVFLSPVGLCCEECIRL
jgi:hypothetical protein